MAERQPSSSPSLVVRRDEPLIGIPEQQNGEQVTRYFADEAAADQAMTRARIARVLALAGAWKDLDWEEAERDLDRIRHASRPTPPLEL